MMNLEMAKKKLTSLEILILRNAANANNPKEIVEAAKSEAGSVYYDYLMDVKRKDPHFIFSPPELDFDDEEDMRSFIFGDDDDDLGPDPDPDDEEEE
jgi:hypothetical protein